MARPGLPLRAGADSFRGRAEAGLTFVAPRRSLVRAAGGYDGIGTSHYHGYALQGLVNVPLN